MKCINSLRRRGLRLKNLSYTPQIVSSLYNYVDTVGFYLKPNPAHANWAAMNVESAANGWGLPNLQSTWNGRVDEITGAGNEGFRGFQVSLPWGLYEKGVSGGNFSNLDYAVALADQLHAEGKYLIIMLAEFREFRNANVSDLPLVEQMRYLLPADLRTHAGLAPSGQSHYLFDNAYAYQKANNTNFGYNLKLYKGSLRARMLRYYQEVANRLANHPAVIAITSTESVIGTAVYTAAGGFASGEGASTAAMLEAKSSIMLSIRAMFPRQMVGQDINGPGAPDYPLDWFGTKAIPGKFFPTASNANWWKLNLNKATSPVGNLRYFPTFAGIAPRFVQWQGDEFVGEDGTSDKAPAINSNALITQRYADLYLRSRNGDGGTKWGLRASHIIIQRENPHPFWLGGTATVTQGGISAGVVVPSLRSFLKNSANVPQDGRGGLDATIPTYYDNRG